MFEEQRIAAAFDLLSKEPSAQPERIAKHYLSLFATAQQLAKLVEIDQRMPICDENGNVLDRTNIRECIAMLTDQIKKNHETDLGIPLEWPRRY